MKRLFTILTTLALLCVVGCEEQSDDNVNPNDKPNTEQPGEKPDDGGANPDITTPPNNQIWYTSTDGMVVIPNDTNVFGANIVSNTYEDDKGIITFNGNITSIGDDAFYNCTSLTSITIPDGVTSIGERAFIFCDSLTSITIPDSVTSIGGLAFRGCTSLTSITIPDSVTWIGNDAFSYCSSLTSITIGNGVTSIGSCAFSGCSSLTSVTIPDGVTSIEYGTFGGCTSLKSIYGKYTSNDGRCLIIGGTLNSFAPAGLTEYTIPDSVTMIGHYAFYYCTSLTSITIPDSVTEIWSSAFDSCSSLTTVTIPDSVTSIEESAFSGCTSLKSIYGKYASNDGRCLIIDGVLNSFAPAGLTEYTIPDSVTSIGYGVFAYCSSLTSITIPDSVTSIGVAAFSGCTSLASVTIGNGVTYIGGYAFYGCTSLTSVYCKATTPPSGYGDMFDDNASGRKIYVPRASVDAYKAAEGWSEYAEYIEPYQFE